MKLILKIFQIPFDGTRFSGELPTDDLLTAENSPLFRFTGAMHYELFAQLLNSSLVIRGKVRAGGEAECCRCLQTFPLTLKSSEELCLFFEEVPESGVLDIGESLREELLMLVPEFPHCSENCQGLCPVCGIDRNQTPCRCAESIGDDSPWDALSPLKRH